MATLQTFYYAFSYLCILPCTKKSSQNSNVTSTNKHSDLETPNQNPSINMRDGADSDAAPEASNSNTPSRDTPPSSDDKSIGCKPGCCILKEKHLGKFVLLSFISAFLLVCL